MNFNKVYKKMVLIEADEGCGPDCKCSKCANNTGVDESTLNEGVQDIMAELGEIRKWGKSLERGAEEWKIKEFNNSVANKADLAVSIENSNDLPHPANKKISNAFFDLVKQAKSAGADFPNKVVNDVYEIMMAIEKVTKHQTNESTKQLKEEAQIRLDITGLESTDAETLSQLLSLAGVAQNSGAMGDPMMADPMGDPMGGVPGDLPPLPAEEPMAPMSGDTLGMDDMGAFDQEIPEPDMYMDEPEIDSGDFDGGFDAAMGDENGMEIEPSDDVDTDMSQTDDDVVLGKYSSGPEMDDNTEELEDDYDLNELLALSGMDALPESEDDDKLYANEPNEVSMNDYSNMPSGGPNSKKSNRQAAPNAVKVVERAEKLKKRLQAIKG